LIQTTTLSSRFLNYLNVDGWVRRERKDRDKEKETEMKKEI
jgi:hypothetical protein